MRSLTIATKGLDKNDDIMFRSMLQIINAQLTVEWEYQAQANVVLVDIETQNGLAFWQHPTEQQILIAYGKENTLQAEWFLPKPVRVKPLVQLLNLLATQQRFTATTPTRPSVITRQQSPPDPLAVQSNQTHQTPLSPRTESIEIAAQSNADYFEPAHSLMGLLQTAQQQQQAIQWQVSAQQPPLLFSPARQLCLTERLQLTRLNAETVHLYNAVPAAIQQTQITEAAIDQAHREHAWQFYSLEMIEWLTALYASQGRLLSGHSLTQLVKLKQWPNLAILPHQPHHIRIAAFMTRNNATLAQIAEQTGLALSVVVNFFNACQLQGLIELNAPVTRLPHKPISAAKRQLFRGILRRLLQ